MLCSISCAGRATAAAFTVFLTESSELIERLKARIRAIILASEGADRTSVLLLIFIFIFRTSDRPAPPLVLLQLPMMHMMDISVADCGSLSGLRMVLTKDIWLPTDEELTVEEVPLGTPSLRAGAMHLGKACEVQNNEFMLCRSETQDPRWVNTREGRGQTLCFLLGNVSRKRSIKMSW